LFSLGTDLMLSNSERQASVKIRSRPNGSGSQLVIVS